MLHLIHEMIFLLLTTALVSALLGRFWCTSNERDIAAEKNACLSELKNLQKQRDKWEVSANKWQQKFAEMDEKLSFKEQEKNNLCMQLAAAEKESEQLLVKLKKADICKSKLSAAQEELNACQAEYQISLKRLQDAKKQLGLVTESHHNAQEQLEKTKQHLLEAVNKNKAFRKHYDALQANNQQLQQKEADYYALKETIAELSQENQQLRQNKSSLQSKLASFKQLYQENQDLHSELDALTAAHDELETTIKDLIRQRNDCLSRLHAVSSVVGAVNAESDDE